MKGVDMMVANLLGINPEDMRNQVNQALALMESAARDMATIKSDLAEIKNHLKIAEREMNNGQRRIESRNDSNAPIQL